MLASNYIITTFLLITTFSFITTHTNAARFDIVNKCPYTVWAASFPVGGGHRLDNNQTWTIEVPAGTKGTRIWGRTGCTFDRAGRGRCMTGDCNGQLRCRTYGSPPTTLTRISLNVFQGQDFFDISVVEGFNLPMEFSPSSGNCTRGARCTADIIGQCPSELRTHGGCNGACSAFETSEYCCTGGSCGPTDYSRFFKSQCPDAYSYPTDNTNDTIYACPGGTDYRVVFCP